ncbi:unnamed protein product [Lactuca virosa]|uniref:Uncharacterized protein n=1 Tax=Lactuca virosa TaxID=75947 RepID=A0AAU9PFN6_9ASTR|nr:unnamed protein product [Lactuca virosa]
MKTSATTDHVHDIDKQIRQLPKKILLMEAQQQKAGCGHDPKQEQDHYKGIFVGIKKVIKFEDVKELGSVPAVKLEAG